MGLSDERILRTTAWMPGTSPGKVLKRFDRPSTTVTPPSLANSGMILKSGLLFEHRLNADEFAERPGLEGAAGFRER